MNPEIRLYEPVRDCENLLQLIQSEGQEWEDYLNPKYRTSLERSITYVAVVEDELCGYLRSMNDPGFFVWVLDLLVHKDYRGHAIGRKLMERVSIDFPDQDVFVMSDVDPYYEKLGYEKEGTIFKVKL